MIGATGMLGREVVRVLGEMTELEVIPASRRASRGVMLEAERGIEGVRGFLASAGPVDLLVNCAGVLSSFIVPTDGESVRRAILVNSLFPHDIALAAQEQGARVVHISTDGVFRPDAGLCFEDSCSFADDFYGVSKRQGEPRLPNSVSLRCSIIGLDPDRHHGLLEWCRTRPPGDRIRGYTNQVWNGVTTTELARVCGALTDPALFERARAEGPVHHVAQDPPVSKFDILSRFVEVFGLGIEVEASASDLPVSRVLGTRHRVLAPTLPPRPSLGLALEELAAIER